MAPGGHDWAHAGCTSPSRISLFSSFAVSLATRILWMQNVHYSITPISLTETSGFNCWSRGFGNLYVRQLKRRTSYGQYVAQGNVPTQRVETCTVRPAWVGHV